jgi:hypothetical protein
MLSQHERAHLSDSKPEKPFFTKIPNLNQILPFFAIFYFFKPWKNPKLSAETKTEPKIKTSEEEGGG